MAAILADSEGNNFFVVERCLRSKVLKGVASASSKCLERTAWFPIGGSTALRK